MPTSKSPNTTGPKTRKVGNTYLGSASLDDPIYEEGYSVNILSPSDQKSSAPSDNPRRKHSKPAVPALKRRF